MRKRPFTNADFIAKAQSIHGTYYLYERVVYETGDIPVEIGCPKHGYFWQKPRVHTSHQKTSGCRDCGIDRKHQRVIERFFKLLPKEHKERYEYVDFIFSKEVNPKAIIRCPIDDHDDFIQDTVAHLKGAGCPHCSNNAKGKTAFLKRAKRVHDDRYDYSLTDYINAHTKIEIVCKNHGSFWQFPCDHINNGAGCPKCGKGFSKKEQFWLQLIGLPDTPDHRQVKISINGTNFRVDGFEPLTNTIFEFFGDLWHGNLNVYTSDYINKSNKKSMKDLNEITLRRIATFKEAGYNLIYIWERNFDREFGAKFKRAIKGL